MYSLFQGGRYLCIEMIASIAECSGVKKLRRFDRGSYTQSSCTVSSIWVFPKIGGNPPRWMVKIMENPIQMDDLGVPLFLERPICFIFSQLWQFRRFSCI